MRETYRIRNQSYTDSDILALFIKYRERKIGPFTREVGDFIAHEKRNRGVSLEATAYAFSQFAFFQRYQGRNRVPIDPFGPCDWWLKTYLLGKLGEQNPREILKGCGLTIKKARIEIDSWFPKNDPYPTAIKCRNPSAFLNLVKLFSRYLRMEGIFSAKSVKKEILQIFKLENIPHVELPHFLIATAVVLSGRSCEIVPGFTANVHLSVEKRRFLEVVGADQVVGEPVNALLLPDGNLTISIRPNNATGDGLLVTPLTLLDTEIDTESYFSRDLITRDTHGLFKLDLDRPLSFERASTPMVFPIDQSIDC